MYSWFSASNIIRIYERDVWWCQRSKVEVLTRLGSKDMNQNVFATPSNKITDGADLEETQTEKNVASVHEIGNNFWSKRSYRSNFRPFEPYWCTPHDELWINSFLYNSKHDVLVFITIQMWLMWFIDSILIIDPSLYSIEPISLSTIPHQLSDLKITADPPDLHLFFTHTQNIPKNARNTLNLIGFTVPPVRVFIMPRGLGRAMSWGHEASPFSFSSASQS